MIAYDFIPLYNCYDVTFYIYSLYFVNEKNKETNKTFTKLAKISFKTQLKNSSSNQAKTF